MKQLWVILLLFVNSSEAFIPSVSTMVERILRDRPDNGACEMKLRHEVSGAGSSTVTIDETLLASSGRVLASFAVRGGGAATLKADVTRDSYDFDGKKRSPRRSSLFVDLLLENEADKFQKHLVSERFVRPDQLMVYKPGFVPKGDPKGWKLSENRMKHDDIYLQRLRNGTAISVNGLDQGLDKRTVYFRQDLNSLARLEWREAGQTVAWNFFSAQRKKGLGYFPQRMSFEIRNREVIRTTLVSARLLSKKQWADEYKKWSSLPTSSNLPNDMESALTMLLSYR